MSVIRPALVVALRELPVTVCLIKDNKLTTPVAIQEVTMDGEVKVVGNSIDLFATMQQTNPQELELMSAIEGHTTKTMYLLENGQLHVFTLSQAEASIKIISDVCRKIGIGGDTRMLLTDMLLADDNTEWYTD